ncbi:MAG: helix-turn-helix domain-containing protein [Bacteroidota bacterium]
MINLNTLAARLHLSRTYAGRVFKDATGENFNDYLNKRRVDRAKELLAEQS